MIRWPVKEIKTHGTRRTVIRVKEPTGRFECEAALERGFLQVRWPGFAGVRRFSRATLLCSEPGMGDYILEAATLPEEARFPMLVTNPASIE